MIGKALEIWFDSLRATLLANEPGPPQSGDIDADLAMVSPERRSSIDLEARHTLESELLRRSDDGILEFLRDEAERQPDVPRMHAVGSLATAVLDRKLYRKAAKSDGAIRPMAAQVFEKFGGSQTRRRLERDCATYVGLEKSWHVLLWIPAPKMRMKAAEVLVDDDERVVPLSKASQRGRGEDIYQAHEALWAVTTYVHRDVAPEMQDVALAWLAREMGVKWEDRPTPSASSALSRIALRVLASEMKLTPDEEDQLTGRDLAASEGVATFEQLKAATRSAIDSMRSPNRGPGARRKRRNAAKQDELPLA
jgi:hypothetical protein